MAGEIRIFSDVLLFSGLVALGIGFLWKKRRCHQFRMVGWVAFAIFWIAQAPAYVDSLDLLNALGSVGAFAAFLYFGYHEHLSYRWDDEYEPLRFVAGAAFIASTIYFVVDRIPQLSAWLIEAVTQQTAAILGFANVSYHAGSVNLVGNPPFYRVNGEEIYSPILNSAGSPVVNIVLACTAIQGMAIAVAMILGVDEPRRKKIAAAAIVLPVTYLMNLVRNVVVIYSYDVQNIDFELAHGYIGKGLALLVLVVLLVFCFWILPELYTNINGLFELPWRKGPGHDYRKYVGRLLRKQKGNKEPAEPPRSS